MRVVFVVGATATGKSSIALEAAQRYQAEILNTDSVQIYKHVDIGTAKPSKDELELVPHHLFSLVEPKTKYSAGSYRKKALEYLADAKDRGVKVVFAVGGSGFYIQALQKGMFTLSPPPKELSERIRKDFKKLGSQTMYEKLVSIDSDYAQSISENDSYRILRAIEIFEHLGKKPSQVQKEFQPEPLPYPFVTLGIQRLRSKLFEIIAKRTDIMLQNGLIEETKALLDRGYGDWAPLASVGYKETVSFLKGELSREELSEKISISTRQLAKRQSTWFRRDPSIIWFDPDHNRHGVVEYLDEYLASIAGSLSK
jgi:tRNA dimethylallyltransferase